MKASLRFKRYLVCLVTINVLLAGVLQDVDAGATTSSPTAQECVEREGLTFDGVGLWTRLPAVLKQYGRPSRIEKVFGISKDHLGEVYYYKDIKLLMFNSIVWGVTALSPGASCKAGVRLSSSFSEVQDLLNVKLRSTTTGGKELQKHRIPICPPDPPEVGEYVVITFDSNQRLVEFTVEGEFP